jgi:hypothetical protein
LQVILQRQADIQERAAVLEQKKMQLMQSTQQNISRILASKQQDVEKVKTSRMVCAWCHGQISTICELTI